MKEDISSASLGALFRHRRKGEWGMIIPSQRCGKARQRQLCFELSMGPARNVARTIPCASFVGLTDVHG